MVLQLSAVKTLLVVSPHLDDGVLSVGGIIDKAAVAGGDVIVATPLTADAPDGLQLSQIALELHAWWNLGDKPYAGRRLEDIQAVQALGARTLHGGLLDAVYRTDRQGHNLYPDRQSVFSEPPPAEEIGPALMRLFDEWLDELRPDLILCPLGVGRHVDHVIHLRALHRVASRRSLNVALYEDLPYSTGLFPPSAPDSVAAALKRTPWTVTAPQLLPTDLDRKLGAVGKYASQLAEIFPNDLDFKAVLNDYMHFGEPAGPTYERLWLTAP